MIAAPDMPELLARAEEGATGSIRWRAANLREMRRLWVHESALPADLVEARTRATSACEMVWREARKNADFKSLLPTLGEVLAVMRRVGEAKAAALGTSLYDALLDEFEPGGRCGAHRRAVRRAARFLPDLLGRVMERQAQRRQAARARRAVPGRAAAHAGRGADAAGSASISRTAASTSRPHPFTGGTADDVRITTRYDEADFARALMGVLHETGHALYELGLPRDWRRQPVGHARGMALHESQSLLMEMQACRSDAFLAFAAPLHARGLRRGRAGLGRPTTSIGSIRAWRRASSASMPTR